MALEILDEKHNFNKASKERVLEFYEYIAEKGDHYGKLGK